MKKLLIVMLMSSLVLQGCTSSEEGKAQRQLERTFNMVSSCKLTKESLQPYIYSNLNKSLIALQGYTPLEQAMMCALYELMFKDSWTIKKVEIVGSTAIATVIYTRYDYEAIVRDVTAALAVQFGEDVILKHDENVGQVGVIDEKELENKKKQEQEYIDFIRLFIEDNRHNYQFETFEIKTIPLINSDGTWKVQSLSSLDFRVVDNEN